VNVLPCVFPERGVWDGVCVRLPDPQALPADQRHGRQEHVLHRHILDRDWPECGGHSCKLTHFKASQCYLILLVLIKSSALVLGGISGVVFFLEHHQ